MNAKQEQEQLKRTFREFLKVFDECGSLNDAIAKGRETFVILDHHADFGGYRLTRVKVENHSEAAMCFGVGGMDPRMKRNEMRLYLRGLINGKDDTFR